MPENFPLSWQRLEEVASFGGAAAVEAALIDAQRSSEQFADLVGGMVEAVRRSVYQLDHAPELLFQELWNLCWWYDCPEAARYYRRINTIASESSESPPWARQGSTRLFRWMEDWRRDRDLRSATRPWLRSLWPPESPLGGGLSYVIRRSGARASAMALAPDGTKLYIAWSDGAEELVDTGSRIQAAVQVGSEPAKEAAFSPDGLWFAAVAADGRQIRVCDARTGAVATRLSFRSGAFIASITFSPDSCRLAAFDLRNVTIWEIPSGKVVGEVPLLATPKNDDTQLFWKTGDSLPRRGHATVGQEGLWHVRVKPHDRFAWFMEELERDGFQTMRCGMPLAHPQSINCACAAADKPLLAAAAGESGVYVWSLRPGGGWVFAAPTVAPGIIYWGATLDDAAPVILVDQGDASTLGFDLRYGQSRGRESAWGEQPRFARLIASGLKLTAEDQRRDASYIVDSMAPLNIEDSDPTHCYWLASTACNATWATIQAFALDSTHRTDAMQWADVRAAALELHSSLVEVCLNAQGYCDFNTYTLAGLPLPESDDGSESLERLKQARLYFAGCASEDLLEVFLLHCVPPDWPRGEHLRRIIQRLSCHPEDPETCVTGLSLVALAAAARHWAILVNRWWCADLGSLLAERFPGEILLEDDEGSRFHLSLEHRNRQVCLRKDWSTPRGDDYDFNEIRDASVSVGVPAYRNVETILEWPPEKLREHGVF